MSLDWQAILARALEGDGISEREALAIGAIQEGPDLDQLLVVAETVRRHHRGDAIHTCGITNAKSGRCPEKCTFCSQSAHFATEAPEYSMKQVDEIVGDALAAEAGGVREFSVVTSGRRVDNPRELEILEKSFQKIRELTGMQTCASLGLMGKEELARLQNAGMESMHHNLETARSFHENIVQTHTYDDEVDTIKAAKSLGMYVCSGGIFGMGENWAQRVELALDLRALEVDSVPVNFLDPRPGTPLGNAESNPLQNNEHSLNPTECLKIIAMLRMVLPTKDIIVCGGREGNLGESQDQIFRAGANGMMLGNYLTTKGNAPDKDRDIMDRSGVTIRPPPRPSSNFGGHG